MLAFALVSSTVYIINDVADIVSTTASIPKKKNRPLAAGTIQPITAGVVALILATSALTLAFVLNFKSGCCCAGYLVINLAYSFKLKHLPIADAFCIAFGFILRLLAGIYVLDQLPVSWLILFTFFLSLFLGFAKRRAELVALDETDTAQRDDRYSITTRCHSLMVHSIPQQLSPSPATPCSCCSPRHLSRTPRW